MSPRVAKVKEKPESDFRIGFLVHDVSRMRRTLFDQEMKPLGITRAQWWILANLSRHGNAGMTQTDLARVVEVGKVAIGRLVDRLASAGYLKRRAHLNDGRAHLIMVTPRGKAVLDKMISVGELLNERILEGLSRAEVHAAETALHRMKENLRAALKPDTAWSDDED